MLYQESEIEIKGKFIKIARIKDDWYIDVEDPSFITEKIKGKADIFTFWQRLPETKPKYNYYLEWISIAVLPIVNFDYWWEKQINAKTRNVVRKAQRNGIIIKLADFDDEFIKGITDIFNETPIRQGKPFWHYGKNFLTIKKEFSKNIHRETIIGAYFNNTLIGFIMLADAGKFLMTTQIISQNQHRDKSPTNALIAKAVEICADKKVPYLVYAFWCDGTLGDFKRHNGFQRMDIPRYYIPLTIKGKIVLFLKIHQGLNAIIPPNLKRYFKFLRWKWNSIKIKKIKEI